MDDQQSQQGSIDTVSLGAEIRELMEQGQQARQRCVQLAGLNAQYLAAAKDAAEQAATLTARVAELEAGLAALPPAEVAPATLADPQTTH